MKREIVEEESERVFQ